MTDLDLDAIEAHVDAFLHHGWPTWQQDVFALVAEIRRLREHEATIRALVDRQTSDRCSGERGWVWHPDLLYVLDDEGAIRT